MSRNNMKQQEDSFIIKGDETYNSVLNLNYRQTQSKEKLLTSLVLTNQAMSPKEASSPFTKQLISLFFQRL